MGPVSEGPVWTSNAPDILFPVIDSNLDQTTLNVFDKYSVDLNISDPSC